jgi:hypothetical protein
MKKLGILALIAAAAALGFYAGSSRPHGHDDHQSATEADHAAETNPEIHETSDGSKESAETTTDTAPTPTTIPETALSPEQRQLLESFGLDPANLTVSEATITCAEEALGPERIAEITAGETPTILEGMRLLGCYGR